MIGIVFRSLGQIFSPALRSIFWRSIALTILLLVIAASAVTSLMSWMIEQSGWLQTYPWIETVLVFLTGFGITITALYVLPAASMLVAGFFLDDVAAKIETQDYPSDRPGAPMSTGSALIDGVQFFFVMLGANVIALFLILLPGINIAAFFVVNAYLFGREYFYLIAGRHESRATVARLYQDHAGTIFGAGFMIAIFVFIPLLNLLTPLFATVLMVHVFKRVRSPVYPL